VQPGRQAAPGFPLARWPLRPARRAPGVAATAARRGRAPVLGGPHRRPGRRPPRLLGQHGAQPGGPCTGQTAGQRSAGGRPCRRRSAGAAGPDAAAAGRRNPGLRHAVQPGRLRLRRFPGHHIDATGHAFAATATVPPAGW